MGASPPPLHLNLFAMGSGHHESAWRLPSSNSLATTELAHFQRLAQIAESARLDAVFLADVAGVTPNIRFNSNDMLDPLMLLSALAAGTERIGLIGTVTTTYNEPFNVARRLASLDHISGGRAGWNIVTAHSEAEAENFGFTTLPSHADRYRRAAEFVDATTALWDSWDEDARTADKDSGDYTREDAVRRIDHVGEHYRVRGPLSTPRPPQGRPVLVQAGASDAGRSLAASYADAVFTAHQTLAEGQAFYRDVKRRAAALGRDPASIKILPGLGVILGSSEREAQSRAGELGELMQTDYSIRQLERMIGVSLAGHPLDGPLPSLPAEEEIEDGKSRFALLKATAAREGLTIRQILDKVAVGRGHNTVVGAPEQVADEIERWLANGAADGFNVMPATLPGDLDPFVEQVVPILRERGLFRREYEGHTLRDHYGLSRAPQRLAAHQARGR